MKSTNQKTIQMRTCSTCEEAKEATEDNFERTAKGYLRRSCRVCRSEARKEAKKAEAVSKKPLSLNLSLAPPLRKDNEPSVKQANAEAIQKLKQSFPLFCSSVWHYLKLPPPTEIQIDIAKFLADTGSDRKMIQAFRGIGKSYLTNAYCLWELWRDPFINILVVSASKERADEFSKFCKSIISQVPYLSELAPRGDLRDSNISFDVGPIKTPGQFPSVKSAGITGQITGSRADIIIADDVEVPNNSSTPDMREKLIERTREFEAILKPGVKGRIIVLGTPQSEESVYTVLPETYTKYIWPVVIPEESKKVHYLGYLTPLMVAKFNSDTPGTPTDPKRFNLDEIGKRRAGYGTSGFELQFMLNTSLSDEEKYPLKLKDLLIVPMDLNRGPMSLVWMGRQTERQIKTVTTLGMKNDRFYEAIVPPDIPYVPYEETIMSVDPSGGGKDETSYAVVKMLNGYLYVSKWGGLQGGYSEAVLEELATIALTQGVTRMVIEDNFG